MTIDKRIVFILVGLFCVNTGFGQLVERSAVVIGCLPLTDTRDHEISLWISDRDNLMNSARTFTTQSKSGVFEFRFQLSTTETFRLTIDTLEVLGLEAAGIAGGIMFIEPGDSIYIVLPTFKSRIYEDVRVTGKGAEKYDFMYQFNHKIASASKELTGLSGLPKIVELKRRSMPMFDQLGGKLSGDSFAIIRAVLLSFYHYSFSLYAGTFDFSNRESILEYHRYSKSFPLDELVVGGKSATVVMEGPFLTHAKYLYLFSKNMSVWNSELSYDEYYTAIETRYRDKVYKSRLLASFLLFRVIEKGLTDEVRSLLSRYYKDVPVSDSFRKAFEITIARLDAGISNGIDLDSYTLVNQRGEQVGLGDFKGKVVLLDFYFFGCLYCKDIAPVMERLEQEFKTRDDIVFLSVSIDATKERFKKGIGLYSSGTSVSLFTGGVGDDHKIIKDFGINGYPTIVIIGKNGEVVDARAPIPRTELEKAKLKEKIMQTL